MNLTRLLKTAGKKFLLFVKTNQGKQDKLELANATIKTAAQRDLPELLEIQELTVNQAIQESQELRVNQEWVVRIQLLRRQVADNVHLDRKAHLALRDRLDQQAQKVYQGKKVPQAKTVYLVLQDLQEPLDNQEPPVKMVEKDPTEETVKLEPKGSPDQKAPLVDQVLKDRLEMLVPMAKMEPLGKLVQKALPEKQANLLRKAAQVALAKQVYLARMPNTALAQEDPSWRLHPKPKLEVDCEQFNFHVNEMLIFKM